MADLSSRLDGCSIFSKLDLQKGYLQVSVRQEDIPKTAIITPFELFEFLRMPFGLRNAGMTFQRMMDQLFFDLPCVFVYLDDLLVASQTVQEHK
jgi:cleavage and polyadenylation specificity factor subunit 1